MMATDSLALETIDGRNDIDVNTSSTTTTKKHKRGKRTHQPPTTNGVVDNGNDSLTESIPSKSPKQFETKKVDESILSTSTNSRPIEENTTRSTARPHQQLTPLQSVQSIPQNYQQIELTAVTDDDDDAQEREQRRDIQPTNLLTTDHDTMVSSFTSGDNDVIEIHEFSLADTDAYLDIYFETLHNRLVHFIGSNDQLQQFRLAMKNRINSDTNSREYQNVLLGKINGDVVSAVTLSFPGETTTISNDNILPQLDSCLKSIRRWMVRNANYIPINIEECYIEMIGVKTAFRNHGIGAAMLECVQHFAQQAGALALTIHVNSDQLRNYFQRSGFNLDHSDNSAYWKWIVERQSILKMSKPISPDNANGEQSLDNTSGYVNDSMIGSEGE